MKISSFVKKNRVLKLNPINTNSNFKCKTYRSKTACKYTPITLPKGNQMALRKFNDEPSWKKTLRGKLLNLTGKNLILCENIFNPLTFTEGLSHKRIGEFKKKFKNLEKGNKVGIFTNRYPNVLTTNKFYTRFFDHFISPDELLNKNFNEKEIFEILSDPNYFKYTTRFGKKVIINKKTLTQTLNEEEKIGPNQLFHKRLNISLQKTKKKINKYLNYYTSVMSRRDMINT